MCILSVYVYSKLYCDALLICRPSVNSGIAGFFLYSLWCSIVLTAHL